jgi:hypothetical protein
MRFERQPHEQTGPAFGALFGGVLLLGAALAAVWMRLGLPRPVCYLRDWTGIPCPTCGSTRLIEALLSGDIAGALAWNPLVFAGLIGIALWAVLSTARLVFGLPAWRLVLSPWERNGVRLLAVLAVAAGWAYLVWRGV